MTRSTTRGASRRRWLSFAALLLVGVSIVPRQSSATVEEQRARLPPPAECPDKVTGTWQALLYNERQGTWYDYQLTIRRSAPVADGNAAGPLEGEMTSHYWTGLPNNDKPVPCTPGIRDSTVKMPGKGTVDAAANLVFGAKTYTVASIACGEPPRYNPDNFSGKIESGINEFQSVNNDGGSAVNEPTVFRRIRCLDAPARSQSKARPPAFAPPKHAWSCGK
jgi:hypothetical protein